MEIKYNAKVGRHAVAKSKIKPGRGPTILHVDEVIEKVKVIVISTETDFFLPRTYQYIEQKFTISTETVFLPR